MSSRCLSTAEFELFCHDDDDPTLSVESTVFVSPRTHPGTNELGGFGTISKIHEDGYLDVKYAVNGKERHVAPEFVRFSRVGREVVPRILHNYMNTGSLLAAKALSRPNSTQKRHAKIKPSVPPVSSVRRRSTKASRVLEVQREWQVCGASRIPWKEADQKTKQTRIRDADPRRGARTHIVRGIWRDSSPKHQCRCAGVLLRPPHAQERVLRKSTARSCRCNRSTSHTHR